MVNEILRPHEQKVLAGMIKFIENRFSWLNMVDETFFLNHEYKMMYYVIRDNKELKEIDLLIEIRNDGIKNNYHTDKFIDFVEYDAYLCFDSHSLEELTRYKRYRDVKKKFDEIDMLDPTEEAIQAMYLDVVKVPEGLEYLTAENCFGIMGKDFMNVNEQLKPTLTGNKEYDEIIGGFTEGMHLIAGRAGTGKSSKAKQRLAEFAKTNPTKATVFFSAEMSKKAMARRVTSYFSKVDNKKIKSLLLTKEEVGQFTFNANRALNNFITVPCNRICTNEATQILEKITKETGLEIGLVCFDYMQKMSPNNKNCRSENEEFINISSDVTEFAKMIPTILISNLNKPREGKEYTCPTVYDIKGGSMLEFDSTSVMMLWKPSADSKLVYTRMLKNRDGEPGNETTWTFDGSIYRFYFKGKGIIKEERANGNRDEFAPFN